MVALKGNNSFLRKQESRIILLSSWIPAFAGMVHYTLKHCQKFKALEKNTKMSCIALCFS